ncbi:MAG: D-alanine--D-alanine ligase [Coriobacteriales bacterium]|jgi:D-alanine-D-alanine ligase|nr:D-alanine--D-alanine ligase [Coriobacteriales bacterium]
MTRTDLLTDSAKPANALQATPSFSTKKYKIVLLCGGTSNEREISLISAQGVQQVMQERGHDVVLVDTGERGFMHKIAHSGADVAFIALHGKGGEDGCIQGALELFGIPYTGSGVLASALAMDKARTKVMYESVGLSTAPGIVVSIVGNDSLGNSAHCSTANCPDQKAAEDDVARSVQEAHSRVVAEVGIPCVVKPVCDGSSVGVSVVHDDASLANALTSAFAVSGEVLVEKFIDGTEITVGVLGNSNAFALPIVEIVPRGGFYDFDSKYSAGGCEHIIPARISDKAALAASAAGLAAHKVLGCSGMSRTDMIVDANDKPWLIETNTIPGMTPVSLLPDAARAAGISAAELYESFIFWALEKAGRLSETTESACERDGRK